jgi:hypothetical protein
MNNLMVLAGLVLVVCVMNSKDLMKSDLVKSLSSKSKSLKMDNTTMLVLGFVVIVLFICMSKNIEGFKMVETDKQYAVGDAKLDGVCRGGAPMTLIVGGNNVAANPDTSKAFHPSLDTPGQFTPVPDPDLNKYLYGCLNGPNARAYSPAGWSELPDAIFEAGSPEGNNSSAYCAQAVDGSEAKVCSRFKLRDCIGEWSRCGSDCQKTYHISRPGSGGATCDAVEGAPGTCSPGEGACPPDVDCDGTLSLCTSVCEKANKRSFMITTPKSGNGQECPVPGDCQDGDGDCVVSNVKKLEGAAYGVVDDSAIAFGNQLGNQLGTQLSTQIGSALRTFITDHNSEMTTSIENFNTVLEVYAANNIDYTTVAKLTVLNNTLSTKPKPTVDALSTALCAFLGVDNCPLKPATPDPATSDPGTSDPGTPDTQSMKHLLSVFNYGAAYLSK